MIEILEMIEESIIKVVHERIGRGSRLETENKEKKGFFYSEDDFQISLIHDFEFSENYKNFTVSYEYSNPQNKRKRIDIVLKSHNQEYPIEIKYAYGIYGTPNIYQIYTGFVNDIEKIADIFKSSKDAKQGYAIILVDEQKYISYVLKKLGINCNLDNNDASIFNVTREIVVTNKDDNKMKYRYLYKHKGINNFHCLIVEISKQN
jgi:hypothetical protein